MNARRGPKPSLKVSMQAIDAAMDAVYVHLRDDTHISSDEELADLKQLAEQLFAYHATAQYIGRKLRERSGKIEPRTDVFDEAPNSRAGPAGGPPG